ncbi:MAG: hypothetical protein AMXMBFR33_50810 [Candidatus Xenobia bacterium]
MKLELDLDLAPLIEQGDILELGRRASMARMHDEVGFLEDEALFLALPDAPLPAVAPRVIHLMPGSETRLPSLRQAFPEAWVHGPAGLDGLDSVALLGQRPECSGMPEVATLTYDQTTPVESLLADLQSLARRKWLVSCVLLPEGVGDQVLSPATTWGSRDVALLSAARLLLRCHVRASWGALGWKLAQASIAFGTDELAGWGLEEQLTYAGRFRPAAQVSHEEAEAGILEAGRIPRAVTRCDWAC